MIISAKDLAKYIRDTVSFDFAKETISSYDQIRRRYDDFYAVENPRAFVALLNDVIGYDNQLIDVFVDLNAADRGFRYFSNSKNRDNPYIAISAFLGDERFEYHKQEIGRVYLAVNTWLCFFGAKEIDAEWKECPICGSAVTGGVCSGKSCKKKQEEFIPIMLELQSMLADEKNGIATKTPKYYKTIAPNSQFGSYKEQIDGIREKRKNREDAAHDEKMKKALAAGELELKKITESCKIESAKEHPDFDTIFGALNSSVAILDALKYGDRAFKTKVDELIANMNQQKFAAGLRKETEANRAEAEADYNAFVAIKTAIDSELINPEFHLSRDIIRKMIADADTKYAKVNSMNVRFPDIYSPAQKTVIDEYVGMTKPSISKRLKKVELEVRLDAAKDRLMVVIGGLEQEYVRCKNLKDGASGLWNRFVTEVEKDAEFIDCRENPAWDSGIYQKETAPLKTKIVALLESQTREKKAALALQTSPLIQRVKNAKPRHKASAELRTALTQIKNNQYFDSIKTSAEYKKDVSWLENNIFKLEVNEESYFKIKWRIILISSAALLLTAVTLYSLFAFFMPLFALNFKTDKIADGEYAVVAPKGDGEEVVEIKGHLPHYFLQKTRRVTSIAKEAFRDNEVIKKCIISENVEEIGAAAFAGCSSLKTVVMRSAVPPKVDYNSFDKHKAAILVPAESYETYLNDSNWKIYADTIFPYAENEDTRGTLIFDSTGGSAVENMAGVQLNAVVSGLPVPTKDGYAFDGWCYYNESGEAELIDSTAPVFKRSTKLYAKWSYGYYTVTFERGDGSENDVSVVRFADTWRELPKPERAGYIFAGWYLGDKKIELGATVEITAPVTLLARWTPLEYRVSFNSSGGSAVSSVTRTFDSEYGTLPVPVKQGYTFGGWKLNGTVIDAQTKVSVPKAHTLIANWIPNTYNIKYELAGGNVVGETTIVCKYGIKTTLATPTRTGYTFAYWDAAVIHTPQVRKS